MDIRLRIGVIYLCAFVLSLIATYNLEKNYFIYPQFFIEEEDSFLWAKLFFWIIIGAILMILITKSKYYKIIIKLMEFTIVFLSVSMLVFGLVLPLLKNISLEFSLFSGILATFIRMRGEGRNEIAILSVAGVSSMIGFSLSPISSLILFFILSIYDYIAVFKTKHMVKLARSLSKEETTFSIKQKQKVVVNGNVKEEFMELGSGDILIPSLIASSFLKVGFDYSIFIIIGTFVGLTLIANSLKKEKRVLPALPYLLIGISSTVIFYMFLRIMLGYPL